MPRGNAAKARISDVAASVSRRVFGNRVARGLTQLPRAGNTGGLRRWRQRCPRNPEGREWAGTKAIFRKRLLEIRMRVQCRNQLVGSRSPGMRPGEIATRLAGRGVSSRPPVFAYEGNEFWARLCYVNQTGAEES